MAGRNLDDSASSPDHSGASVSLGGATVDLARQTVQRGGQEIRLRPRAADVLAYLVRHAGRVVTKRELIEAVWGDVAVTDDSLVQCLVEIRRALGAGQDLVRTVRGRGYLLDHPAPVADAASPDHGRTSPAPTLSSPASPAAPPAEVPLTGVASSGPDGAATPTGDAGRSTRPLAVAAAAVLVLGASVGVVVRLAAPPSPIVAPSETMNLEARRAFESAAEILRRSRSQVSLQEARLALQRAVDLDPGFAAAHAALANTTTVLSAFGVEPPAEVLPTASAAARRAIDLDPTLAAGWQALAHTNVQWEHDWQAAERHYRRALALNPNADGNYLFAHLLVGLGRTEEAIAVSDRAVAGAPASPVRLGSNCVVKYLARWYDAAVDACDRALAADGAHSTSHFWKALALIELRRFDEAMAAALDAGRQMGNAPAWVVGFVHARAGRDVEAREVLAALEARAERAYVPPVDIALLRAAVGDHAGALDWLERGRREHGRWMELLAVLPAADPLRLEPRFRALLHALRLPELP